MNKRLITTLSAASFLLAGGAAYAGPIDGMEDFSVDRDWSVVSGAPANGQINFSPENSTWGDDFAIPLQTGDEIDALSSHHRENPWQHNVSLADMIAGTLEMTFSVDSDGNIFEWHVSGDEPVPNGVGRTLSQDGHFPATPNPIGWTLAHDSEDDLFGTDPADHQDLDALEHHDHSDPYPYPFPGAPTNWEDNASNVYFSTELGGSDTGDVFNMGLGTGSAYVDDTWICAALTATGYQNCDDSLFNIDGLIVYDIEDSLEQFDAVTDKWDSDAIFFSLDASNGIQDAAGATVDAFGDVVWWASASGVAGVYADPNLDYNVDALDVHQAPAPATLALLGLGLAGLAGLRRRQPRR